MTENGPDALSDLRVEIDRIDLAMHALLMERGEIIGRLIRVKSRQGGGSAFRPAREAEMMRRVAERHAGLLPLDAAESIWRIIISTFTYAQAPYSVHVDASGGDAAMRDSTRFHFGFTPPYVAHASAAAAVAAVSRSHGDLGLIRIDQDATAGAWWTDLTPPSAPKVIARLPFVERPDHPAGAAVFVIAQPLAEAASRDEIIYCASFDRWRDEIPGVLHAGEAEILANASDGRGLSLLLAVKGEAGVDWLRPALGELSLGDVKLAEVGSHARRYDLARSVGKDLQ